MKSIFCKVLDNGFKRKEDLLHVPTLWYDERKGKGVF